MKILSQDTRGASLKPQAGSLLFAAVLLLLQPLQIEEVDPVFQIGGLMLLQLSHIKKNKECEINWTDCENDNNFGAKFMRILNQAMSPMDIKQNWVH